MSNRAMGSGSAATAVSVALDVSPYEAFLASKVVAAPPCGFEPVIHMPAGIKPFQRDIVTWACRRGRAAIFAATGTGKSLQELSWAQQVVAKSGGRVLIFTPLAVAEQTVREADKFSVPGVSYAPDEGSIGTPITVTNYERRDKFDLSGFAGVVCDESGIFKSYDGKTRKDLTEACAGVPYLLCGTATPAPNDWTELGQHAEFLGVMSAKEMLSMFFVHDGSNRAGSSADADGWRLKRHAQGAFWEWVASWAVMIRHPRDLGYEEPGYDLPPLRMEQVTVAVDMSPTGDMLFPMQASSLQERIRARRDSIDRRIAAAVEIVSREPDEPWLIWCRLNAEADAMAAALPGAVNVEGKMHPDAKVENLLGFVGGCPRHLVTKDQIAGRGLNYQHCTRMIFLGLSDSFEAVYQAVRRCWRFGQAREVVAYMITSELEGAVVRNVLDKERKHEAMVEAMAGHMRDLCRREVRSGRRAVSDYRPSKPMELPAWLS